MIEKKPTIAQLRKLAKRKGWGFIRVDKLPQEDGDTRVFFFTTVVELYGSTTVEITSGSDAKVRIILCAAISALDDAKGTKR